jgi:predicted dehydrogenase
MIKVAQIGTSANSHGNGIWGTMQKYPDLFELVGYAFPENEREKFPKQAEAFNGYREMTVEEILSDPEITAVTVETEEIYLTKYALMVAKAGKHLHMEKPGGAALAPFEEMVGILKENGLVFSTGYMYRFNPAVRAVLERVKRGELGRIYAVEAHMGGKHSLAQREWLATLPGGMMFFLGCHLIDLIYRIQGEPLEVIPLSASTGIDGVGSIDYGMVALRYPNGVSFAKTCDEELGGFTRRQLVICGERGTIEIRPLEGFTVGGMQYSVTRECKDTDWVAEWQETKSEPYERYDAMMRNFAEIVRGKENPYSYDYELSLYRLIRKACGREIS